MSGSVNLAIIVGRLGKDPELRTTQSGARVASLSVATDSTWRDKATGETKKSTQWHRVVIYNEPLVKVIEQYARKGSLIWVRGEMQTRKWNDKGVDRWVTEVILGAFCAEFHLLERKPSEPQPPAADGPDAGSGKPDFNDEIPF